MLFGISFYLGYGLDDLTYLQAARRAGVKLYFTSLHVTELDPRQMASSLQSCIATLDPQAEVVADVSPRTFDALGAAPDNLEPLAALGLKGLRIDYGFPLSTIARMADNPFGIKIVLNASTVDPQSVAGVLPPGGVEFWHNFYPRPETGLGFEWMVDQSKALRQLGFRVGAFLPWLPTARPPLALGLPTVERHRLSDVRLAAAELIRSGAIDLVLMGDPCRDVEILHLLQEMVEDRVVPLRIAARKLTPREQATVDLLHTSRRDPSEWVLRSASSRTMAAIGEAVQPQNCGLRPRFTVTVDNAGYQRYAGELQITLRDLPADERVNVVGHVIEEDWPLVELIRPGGKFRLVAQKGTSHQPLDTRS
ncbi:MAG: MupG family TIM beta-alpha barrel fold protein [Bacillota bacterium]